MARLFLTGATGFLGQRVLAALERRGHGVMSLMRGAAGGPRETQGDLNTPATYVAALAGVDAVVHLAAVTGKAAAAEFERVNVEGTRALVDAARDAGVRRFLFCSTIAVTFPDIRHYPYARSKSAGEAIVAGSGLRTVTVRPTIIAGPGSPVMSKFAALAALPVVPAFGGGRARVQPIDVDDLAELIADIVDTDRFEGEILETGGRDVFTVRQLLGRLRVEQRGSAPRFLTVPMGLILAPLHVLEPVLGARLPLTIGQLATFRFDGVARPNTLVEARAERLAPVELVLSVATPPSEARPADLARECGVFTRFLIGCEPTPYVVAKYMDAHRVLPNLSPLAGFERVLVERASRGPTAVRLADAYARRRMPMSALRRKLVLLLAILETSPVTHARVDTAPTGSLASACVTLVSAGVAGVAAAGAGLIWFGALRLFVRQPSAS